MCQPLMLMDRTDSVLRGPKHGDGPRSPRACGPGPLCFALRSCRCRAYHFALYLWCDRLAQKPCCAAHLGSCQHFTPSACGQRVTKTVCNLLRYMISQCHCHCVYDTILVRASCPLGFFLPLSRKSCHSCHSIVKRALTMCGHACLQGRARERQLQPCRSIPRPPTCSACTSMTGARLDMHPHLLITTLPLPWAAHCHQAALLYL